MSEPLADTDQRLRTWNSVAIARLLNTSTCPVCESRSLLGARCTLCGADLSGPVAAELWEASRSAVAALRERESIVARVPRTAVAPAASAPAAPEAPSLPAVAVASSPAASATVQSVLALAGAGLVAVAAIIFTFFNPDLTDAAPRSLITGLITVVFLGGAMVLMRRGLRFSAEAVGALGLVFLALDVDSFANLAPERPWLLAAGGTLVAGSAMVLLAVRFRLRIWLWTSLAALSFTPMMLGLAAESASASAVGWLGSAVAASSAIEATRRLGRRFGSDLLPERVTLTVVQAGAVVLAIGTILMAGGDPASVHWWQVSALLLAIWGLSLLSTRHIAGRMWSFVSGGAGVLATAAIPLAFSEILPYETMFALLPGAGAVGLIVFATVVPIPRQDLRGTLTAGSVAGLAVSAMVTAGIAVLSVLGSLIAADEHLGAFSAPVVLGLAALAAGLQLFALLRRRQDASAIGSRRLGDLGLWIGLLAALTLASASELELWSRIAIGLALAIAAATALATSPRLRTARAGIRMPLLVGAHALIVSSALISWQDDATIVWAGVASIAALCLVAPSIPVSARFLHVGAGYAYALVTFATACSHAGLEPVQVLCLTTSVGALTATASTFVPFVRPRAWYAILLVTSVPFVLGVVQVLFERNGWTALSTGLIFLLCGALVITRRPGFVLAIRGLAAGLLVPSLAVVVVCLGAQLLATSGSPVVLPVVAALVALALPSTTAIASALTGRIGARHAEVARLAIEASTLLTAVLTVALALVRQAAGLGTAFVVLILLGVGGAATALWARRVYGWALAGASLTGALWCVWGMVGVDTLEPFLLPPALGAAVVGAALTARGRRGMALYATGLAVAIVPIIAVLAVQGSWPRGLGLVAASVVLTGVGGLLGGRAPWLRRVRALRPTTFVAAIVAGAGGAVAAVRIGMGWDAHLQPAFLACFALGVAGAVPAALAARAVRAHAGEGSRLERTRWLLAPACLYVAVAACAAIDSDPFTVWAMWSLMTVYLVLMVVTAARQRRTPTSLLPVWFLFAIALATSIVAWSPRELRVEWFSLPLGFFLLAAGALHLGRAAGSSSASLNTWPAGYRGSWALLAPGIVVLFSASIAATLTDPATWRAILVIVLALIAILIGSGARLAAPFILGIVVLPVENALAFLVQIGRGIESMPWWITLAVVGAVLLIIAVTYERREGEGAGIAARLRDLS